MMTSAGNGTLNVQPSDNAQGIESTQMVKAFQNLMKSELFPADVYPKRATGIDSEYVKLMENYKFKYLLSRRKPHSGICQK